MWGWQRFIKLSRIDVIQLGEAFAVCSLPVQRALGLKDDDARVNACDCAFALSHPLGASGRRYALCTMGIGVCQGITLILETV